MDKDEALWMALGVLEFYYDLYKEKVDANVIAAIKEALAQPKRTWVGLTDEELAEFSDAKLGSYDLCLEVEAKLREKNGE